MIIIYPIYCCKVHEKNDFAEVSQNLDTDTSKDVDISKNNLLHWEKWSGWIK